jgi:hypothetical protein
VYGPSLVNHDVNLGRKFYIPALPENSTLEFRGEAYNLTNTPYFSNPNTSLGQATAGRITGVADTLRGMQLGLKLNFRCVFMEVRLDRQRPASALFARTGNQLGIPNLGLSTFVSDNRKQQSKSSLKGVR